MKIMSMTESKRVNSDEDVHPTKVEKLEGIKAPKSPFGVGTKTLLTGPDNSANPSTKIMSMIGRKRVNSDEDVRPTKVEKLEGIKAAETPFGVGRNTEETASDDGVNRLNNVLEEDLKKPNDGEQETQACDKSAAKEVPSDIDAEVNTLRQMMKEDSKSLAEKDQKRIIECIPVKEIINLALESGQGKGRDEKRIPERTCFEDMNRITSCMLYNPEKVKIDDFCRLYSNLHYKDTAVVALLALDSEMQRRLLPTLKGLDWDSDPCFVEEAIRKFLNPLTSDQRDMICDLCLVLPPILLDHVFFDMTNFHLFCPTLEESDKDCPTPILASNKRAEESDVENSEELDTENLEEMVNLDTEHLKELEDLEEMDDPEECKKAAQECPMCLGKGIHTGLFGFYCSFKEFVPKGAVVGSDYCVACRECGQENENPISYCWLCGSEGGQAFPKLADDYF